MRVAVTGADGFTGRYVIAALRERRAEPVVLSSDLTSASTVAAEIAAKDFDVLIHLAAIAFVATADWRPVYAVNQIGTFNLLDAVAMYRPATRCILASSAQVYGPQASGLISESALPRPANAYAVSKYAMELGAAQWSDRLGISLVRAFNYTGVGQEVHYLIPKIVDHFRRRENVIELGNIDVARDFGDVRAAAAAYVGLALDCTEDVTVNLCTGAVTKLADVVAAASSLTGHVPDVKVNPAFVRANDVATLGGDATYLRLLLPNWQPIPLRETLEWMLTP